MANLDDTQKMEIKQLIYDTYKFQTSVCYTSLKFINERCYTDNNLIDSGVVSHIIIGIHFIFLLI